MINAPIAAKVRVVGNKFVAEQLIEHGMSPGDNFMQGVSQISGRT
jgi:hypothetical protein